MFISQIHSYMLLQMALQFQLCCTEVQMVQIIFLNYLVKAQRGKVILHASIQSQLYPGIHEFQVDMFLEMLPVPKWRLIKGLKLLLHPLPLCLELCQPFTFLDSISATETAGQYLYVVISNYNYSEILIQTQLFQSLYNKATYYSQLITCYIFCIYIQYSEEKQLST